MWDIPTERRDAPKLPNFQLIKIILHFHNSKETNGRGTHTPVEKQWGREPRRESIRPLILEDTTQSIYFDGKSTQPTKHSVFYQRECNSFILMFI